MGSLEHSSWAGTMAPTGTTGFHKLSQAVDIYPHVCAYINTGCHWDIDIESAS